MNAIQFFKSPVLDLPKTRNDDIQRYASRMFDDYLAELSRVDDPEFISTNVRGKYELAREVSTDLKTLLDQHFGGDKDGAYATLKKVTGALGKHFEQFLPPDEKSRELHSLYRMAVETKYVADRKRLFHPPFDHPEWITSQRYSVEGLPCLYFGGSSYLCWRELREPAEDHLYISRFMVAPDVELRVVNLAYRPDLIARYIANMPDAHRVSGLSALIIAYAAIWPIMSLCALKRPQDDNEFKEYVVPQMLLKWVVETKQFDGIRYFSTRTDEIFDDPKATVNYVFPARTRPAAGC